MFARMATRRSQARRAARVLHQQPMQVASEELRILIARLEDLVERLGSAAEPEVSRLRRQAEGALANARAAIAERGVQLGDQVRDFAAQGQEYVRRRPMASASLAALGLLAIGVLASRALTGDDDR
jgi:ElaB/YqjD/DUF883 family membrane-anchored ribosome-binding protein